MSDQRWRRHVKCANLFFSIQTTQNAKNLKNRTKNLALGVRGVIIHRSTEIQVSAEAHRISQLNVTH